MGLKFPAANNNAFVLHTTAGPAAAAGEAWSFTLWARLNGAPVGNRIGGIQDTVQTLEIGFSDNTFELGAGVGQTLAPALVAGRWYFFGFTYDGVSAYKGYVSLPDGAGPMTVYTGADATVLTLNNHYLGNINGGTAPANATIDCRKTWRGVVLRPEEIAAEQWTRTPQRTDKLYAWWPMMTRDRGNLDFHMNHADFVYPASPANQPTTDEDAPIPWA